MVAAATVNAGTDSVRISLPKGAKITQVVERLNGLGPVAKHDVRQGKWQTLDVVFFDTRTALMAAETLGAKVCSLMPRSKLVRTVQLPGSVQLDQADVPGLLTVKGSNSDDSFTLEFYDSRVAKKYQEKVEKVQSLKTSFFAPPGLAPPPGLDLPANLTCKSEKNDETASVASTTAASASIDDEPSTPTLTSNPQVKIRGLPAPMLQSECTLSAMMQQAGLEGKLKNLSINKADSEVVAELADAAAAQRCVSHFHGRQWGAAVVSAELIGAPVSKTAGAKQLSAAATEFVPGKAMSAAAPAFVPGASRTTGLAVVAKRRTKKSNTVQSFGVASSASTEIGSDSDSQDKSPMYIGY